jgi:hypothetical protein
MTKGLIDFRVVADHAAAEIGLDRSPSDHVGRNRARSKLFGRVHFDCALFAAPWAQVPVMLKRGSKYSRSVRHP